MHRERLAFMNVSVSGRPPVQFCIDLEAGDPVAEWFMVNNWIDSPVQRVFLDLIGPGSRVVDLGCHLGTFALGAAGIGAEVIAADANEMHVRLIRAAAERNGFTAFEAVNCVMGATSEPVSFVVAGPWGRVIWPGETHHRAVTLPSLTLDELLETRGWDSVDVMKMDVEGSEIAVLQGATRLLESGCRPAIVFECNGPGLHFSGSTVNGLRQALADLGYELYHIDHLRQNVLVRTEPDAPQPEAVADYLAVTSLPESLLATWTVEQPYSLERTAMRLIDHAASDASGYRRYVAQLLESGPPELTRHPLVLPCIRALALDTRAEVRDEIGSSPEGAPREGTAPAPGDPGDDLVVLAVDVAVAQPLALDLPPALELAPAVEALGSVSFHLCKGQALGVLADERAAMAALFGALAGSRTATGDLAVQGRVHRLSSIDALVERELTVAENIAVIAAWFGGHGQEVRARVDNLVDFLAIRELMDTRFSAIPPEKALKLVIATVIESMSGGLLLVDPLPLPLDEGFRAWTKARLGELQRTRGLAVIQAVESGDELIAATERGLWLAGGETVACGHWQSLEQAFQESRLDPQRAAVPRAEPRPLPAHAVPRLADAADIGTDVLVAALLGPDGPGSALDGRRDRPGELLQPWRDSVHLFPGLRAVVLHDGLPEDVLERLASPQITFIEAPPPARSLPPALRRYEALAALLAGAESLQRLWFTDIDDVGFVLHPFRWLDGLGLADTQLCIGEEWGPGAGNEWFERACQSLGPEYEALLEAPWSSRPLLSPSAWAASRSTAVELTGLLLGEIDRLQAELDDPEIPVLPVLNLVAQRHLGSRLATFKVDASLSGPIDEAGVFVRGAGNPVVHNREKAMALVGELRARSSR